MGALAGLRSVLVNDKKMRMSKDPVQMKDIIQEVVTLCLSATSGKDGQPMLRPGAAYTGNGSCRMLDVRLCRVH